MSREEFELLLHDIKFNAGMNQDYWRDLGSMYEGWDNAIKISVLVLTVLAFAISLIELRMRSKATTPPANRSGWRGIFDWLWGHLSNSPIGKLPFSAKMSLLSVMAAIVLNTISYGASAQQAHLLFQQWTMLRGEIIDLELSYKASGRDTEVPNVDERYTQLLRMITNRISRVESQEPAANTERLQAAYDREALRQGLDPNWDKKEPPPESSDDTASTLPDASLR